MNIDRTIKAAVLAGFLILLAIRIVHIEADPPYTLSLSGAAWGDPGGYNFNARNKVLFGSWEIDDYNMMYTSYPPHLLTYGIYRVFGVGFAQQNSVPVLFSFLTILFFFLILRRRYDEKIALLGAFLLGINYIFLMFSRIANRDMPAVFFLVLTVYFLQKAEDRAAWLPAAGAAAALSLTSKSFFFFILGGALFGYFLHLLHQRKPLDILRRVALIAAGAAVILIPWTLFIFIPHKASIQSFNSLNVPLLLPPADPVRLLRHFWERPAILLNRMPILAVFGGLFSLRLLYQATHRRKKLQVTDWVFLSWFFSGALYLAVIYQRFPRRFIPQILPLVFLAVSWAAAFLRKETNGEDRHALHWAFPPLLFIWMLFPVSLLLKFLNGRFPQAFRTSTALNLCLLGLSLLFCAAVTVFALRASRRSAWNAPVRVRSVLVLILFLLYCTGHGRLYLDWALAPPHQFRDISQDYGKAFSDAVFAGLWAPSICTENTHRAHEYFRGYINSREDFFPHFGITHVFTTTHYGEDRIFFEDFPKEMQGARLLARYHIWIVQALLYEIHPGPEEGEPGSLEAELYTEKGSTPRFDQQASARFAVRTPTGPARTAVEIPADGELPPGEYTISFHLRGDSSKRKIRRLARIDVIDAGRRSVLAARDLSAGDLEGGEFREFPLNIRVRRKGDIRFRVYSDGVVPLWTDRVTVKRTGSAD